MDAGGRPLVILATAEQRRHGAAPGAMDRPRTPKFDEQSAQHCQVTSKLQPNSHQGDGRLALQERVA
jgi:hypothetical protein